MTKVRDDDFIAALRADIVRTLVEQTGAQETHVIPVASRIIAAMQQRFAGNEVYIRGPRYDAKAVLADFTGRNHTETCRKHGISRRTLYRLTTKA